MMFETFKRRQRTANSLTKGIHIVVDREKASHPAVNLFRCYGQHYDVRYSRNIVPHQDTDTHYNDDMTNFYPYTTRCRLHLAIVYRVPRLSS